MEMGSGRVLKFVKNVSRSPLFKRARGQIHFIFAIRIGIEPFHYFPRLLKSIVIVPGINDIDKRVRFEARSQTDQKVTDA
jgi:hypothetical protein